VKLRFALIDTVVEFGSSRALRRLECLSLELKWAFAQE